MNMDNFPTNLWSNKEASTFTTISNPIPSPLQHRGLITLPTQQAMNGVLEENWSNQQPLWQQHHENGHNSSNQSSPAEIALEDLLVSWGVVKKGHSSCSISYQPSPPNMYNTSSLPTYQMGELLGENQGDQHFLWKQHCENAHNSSYQSSPEEITFEDFLMKLGVIQKGQSSSATSFQRSPPIIYDTSSLQIGLEGISFGQVEGVAHGDHSSPGSVMSGVGPGGIFYEKGWMGMTKIEGHEQRLGDMDHQNLGNIMSKACPTKICYNTGESMGITGIGVQQTKVDNGGHLGSAMREIYPEEMCFSGVGSIGTKRIEGQQLGMASSVTPMSIDSLIMEPKIHNDKGMEVDRSGKRKHKVYKTKEKEMEKKRKDKMKNRESASRSRARKEAYKMDLEWTVNKFNNENAQLKRDLEELRTKMLQKPMNQQESINEGKIDHALRRCNSCPC